MSSSSLLSISFIDDEEEIYSLQQLLDKIHNGGANAPEEELAHLAIFLNEALQAEPCFTLEQYQFRILQLRSLHKCFDDHPNAAQFISLLNKHMVHAETAARNHQSQNPIQDSLWMLIERILNLPTITPDLFGAAVATLQENLPNAVNSDQILRLKTLFTRLVPPAHYFWGKNPPYHEELECVENILQELSSILDSGGSITKFQAPLQSIYDSYQSFIQEFRYSTPEEQAQLIVPKAQIAGVGLGFFSIDQYVARLLLSKDEKGDIRKSNSFGIHPVRHEAGVFYKPNPEDRNFIGPEKEFAVYALYQMFGSQGAAPTALLKLRHVCFNSPQLYGSFYGRALQASYGIDGMLLQDFIGMAEILPFLESCLGQNEAQNAIMNLVFTDWEANCKANFPDLYSIQFKQSTLEVRAERFVQLFVGIFQSVPVEHRCLEMQEIPLPYRSERDFLHHISSHGTDRLAGAFALLTLYPQLAYAKRKDGTIRQTSLTVEITDLYYYLTKLQKNFCLSPATLVQELPTWFERFDSKDFSIHFLVTLLSNPSDHKTDNLMIKIDRNSEGGIGSIKLFGIDNDLAFGPSYSVRSVLYLLPPMHWSFDSSLVEPILKMSPEGIILDWLVALQEQNQRYIRCAKQGVLANDDLFHQVDIHTQVQALRIPLVQEARLVPEMYRKAQLILKLLRENPKATHWEILRAIEPDLAVAYSTALESEHNLERAYGKVPHSFPNNPERIEEEPVMLEPHESALQFWKSLHFQDFPLKLKVSLLGKFLHGFPQYSQQVVVDILKDHSRKDIWIHAVELGHTELVANLLELERKQLLLAAAEPSTGSLIEMRDPTYSRTALLIACNRLDLPMIEVLLFYGADPQVHDVNSRGPITSCLQKFSCNPVTVANAIRKLGNQSRVLFNHAGGHRGFTPLHHLVQEADSVPEHAEALIGFLVSKGACPDLQDNRQLTPLDYAIKFGNERVVKQLISLGGGIIIDVPNAIAFFNERPHLKNSENSLKKRSLIFRWYIALQSLKSISSQSNVTLESSSLGSIYLPEHITRDLLSESGDIRATISCHGRRNVRAVRLPCGEQLFFKQFPEMPGIEYAVNSLFKLLIGHGTSYTELARLTVHNQNQRPYFPRNYRGKFS